MKNYVGELGWPKFVGKLGWVNRRVLKLACPTPCTCLFKLRPGVLSKTLFHMWGKFNLPYIWDRVLLNTTGLNFKRHAQGVGHANSNTLLLTQPNLPTHLGQPNSPTQFFTGSEHAHRTS